MFTLTVGRTDIPYIVRNSGKSTRRRIIVTPDRVEVVLPSGTPQDAAHGFIRERREWVFTKLEEVQRLREQDSPWPGNFVTGAKVLFRGRRLRLTVRAATGRDGGVEYRNGFIVTVPEGLEQMTPQEYVREALTAWFKRRVHRDAAAFARRHGEGRGLVPKAIRVKEQKHLWGSCGKDDIINLNWQLIFAPKPVLEYAVVHELCHLRHRNHDTKFWGFVRSILPDFEERRAWLDANQKLLSV